MDGIASLLLALCNCFYLPVVKRGESRGMQRNDSKIKGGLIMLKPFDDFYLKQQSLIGHLEKQLEEEIERYRKCFKKDEMRNFTFKLHKPTTLEELPLILLMLKNRPSFNARWFLCKKKYKVESLIKLEEFLKLLGIEPFPRPPEVEEYINSPEEY